MDSVAQITEQWSLLEQVRRPQLLDWEDITRYVVPYAGRYVSHDRDRNLQNWRDIIDETATHSLEILESAMISHRTSPARPWFRLQAKDGDLNKSHRSKKWLQRLTDGGQSVLRASKSYLALSHVYIELGAFGNGCSIMTDDFDTVIHHTPLTAGEYVWATDGRGYVDTCLRKFAMTVGELVKEFKFENCSRTVQSLYKQRQLHVQVTVIHAIQPRLERNPMSWANTDMPWSSVYIELDGDGEKFLRRSGHRRFPVLAPRWRVTGLDIYGHGPGRKALNNVLQLQAQELEKGKAMAVQADPPTQVPVSVKHLTRELLPGGVIPYDQSTPHGGVRTAYEVPLNLDHMRLDSMEVRRRIEAAFYVPLFQTLNSLNDSTERTAFEMRARREEAFTLLGPVTQRLNNELDEPLVRTIIERMIETGMVEPPPPELQGQPLEIEFLGPLAQALKAVGLTNTDRFVAGLGIVAGLKPDVRDKFDEDSWAEQYADVLGVHPDLIVPGPKVALIRESRAQAMAAKERNEMMATQAGTVRDLAAAPTGGEPNALTDITGTLAGYTQPAGVGL